MDTGRGTFAEISKERASELTNFYGAEKTPIFRIGEIVKIKGSRFKITEILKRGRLKLKLLKGEGS